MKLSAKPEGFTLTELLIVLLIIGILVAIAIPNDLKFGQKIKELAWW
jgi:prepilin-type N-terminal cleavage/methylation domain-containing protein